MIAHLESIVEQLGARRCGSQWIARCPAHDDRNPSLSIGFENGKVLLHCHAGCAQSSVIAALGNCRLQKPRRNERGRIVATYDYTDAAGVLLYQVVRLEPKSFRHRMPNRMGGWIWRKSPTQVLYRLPEVLRSENVFLVEGERDAETLRDHGFAATTNAGGAKARWLQSYTQALQNRRVVLVPDNDLPGYQHAAAIAKAIKDHVKELILLELDSNCKDITDWFDQGHSEVELVNNIQWTRF